MSAKGASLAPCAAWKAPVARSSIATNVALPQEMVIAMVFKQAVKQSEQSCRSFCMESNEIQAVGRVP